MKNIIVISSYPQKGQIHDKKIVGGASYTKTLLINIRKYQPKINITVYAEIFNNKETYEDETIIVKRTWKRNDIFSIFNTVSQAIKQKTETIIVSYEVNMVGGIFANIALLLSLYMAKIAQRKIYFIPHQVVTNFKNIENNPIKIVFLNLFKDILFKVISDLSYRVIVFEEHLKKYFIFRHNTVCVPLVVDNLRKINKKIARKKLGLNQRDFYILYFGFLSPYKGIDKLLQIYNNTKSKLILAGGINPNHKKNKKYIKYVSEIKKTAQKKHIITTGFINEKDIKYYYSACDMVILPYRIFFSSSFPLSLAFSYEKPVLLSKPLQGYFDSKDFQYALKKTNLHKNNFIYEPTKKNLIDKISLIKKKRKIYSQFSTILKNRRSWNKVVPAFLQILEII